MTDTNKPVAEDYGFENKTIDELRKIVSDIVSDNMSLSRDKKAYVTGVNDILKENNKRMEAAVEAVKHKVALGNAAKLEAAAETILAKK